eukprot:TRINITY_DN3037_c0_g1_i3.p1 TRINITY_DN3037_c0_g1~~TRINITY_DN3037_c0_g1_i3.p1  ORF type:complete len:259 (-),score=62.09 TRINITY_DN3037_c0_g1_i3:632-1321(-)
MLQLPEQSVFVEPKLRAHTALRCPSPPRKRRLRAAAVRGGGEARVPVRCLSPEMDTPEQRLLVQQLQGLQCGESYFKSEFECLQTLHNSASSSLFRVQSHTTGTQYSVKKVNPKGTGHSAMFEVKVLAYLWRNPSPYCVPFFCAWAERDKAFLQEGYAPWSLAQDFPPPDQFYPETTVLKYFCHILQAVNHLHQHSILHLDIKPNNILVGRDGRLLLADFGCARFTNGG